MDPRTVLIVDSDLDSLNIYSLVLEHNGFRVLSATDARRGWVIALEERPAVVLTELILPELGGVTLLQLLSSSEATERTAVVAITSLPPWHLWAEPEQGGYAGYLLKPCTPSRVLEEVRRVLSEGAPAGLPVALEA